jgi:MFS family permease
MRRLALASMIGTTLEWYDFALYNAMAALIFNRVFFPSFSPLAGTLMAFSTYAVGYFARPIGGTIFGRLGDRLGRRDVLTLTLTIMGATTFLMSLLPGYATIGVASPLLLVTLRFIQGVALGGEWAGAVLLSAEHGAHANRGLNGSWAQVGPSAGTLLATAGIGLTTWCFTDSDFVSWGWRVPFVVSAVLVVFGLWLRRSVPETPDFAKLKAGNETAQFPITEVFTSHKRALLIACMSKFGPDVIYNLNVTFSLTYATQILHLGRTAALIAVWIGAALNAVAVPYFGALSDRLGRRAVYGAGIAAAALWTFSFFPLLNSGWQSALVIGVAVGLICHAAMFGPQAAFITEQFPTRVRYTGASLAVTLAGLLSGSTPVILLTLLTTFHSPIPLSLYATALLVLSGASLILGRRKPG